MPLRRWACEKCNKPFPSWGKADRHERACKVNPSRFGLPKIPKVLNFNFGRVLPTPVPCHLSISDLIADATKHKIRVPWKVVIPEPYPKFRPSLRNFYVEIVPLEDDAECPVTSSISKPELKAVKKPCNRSELLSSCVLDSDVISRCSKTN